MQPLTDDELLVLLDSLESDRSERKESWAGDAPDKGSQALCAFANDLPNHKAPGVLFVGARDDGSPAHLPVTDQLLLTLANIKSSGNITPPPSMTVEKRVLKGAEMAVVTVWPADAPPVRFKGRIWIRTGPRRDIATAQDERILVEKRRFADRHFDSHPVRGSTLTDLSRGLFESEYLPSAVAPDILAANERTYEQRLAASGMVASAEEPVPTVLGLLCLGISPRSWLPGSYVQFLRIRGTEWGGDVMDAEEIDGTAGQLLRRLDDKVKAHLTTSVDYKTATVERRISPYPLVALQQIARNAVMHRNYEGTAAPVRFYWFDDRIEILSPGGPYGSVTEQNFGQPGYSDYRNPGLATAMKHLGFVQRFGFGISDARRALADNGNSALEFQVNQAHVLVVIRKAP